MFRSRRAGNFDVVSKNLTTNQETIVTQTPEDDFPVISPDGTRVAYSFRQNDKTPIFVAAVSGGSPELVCADCGEVEQWAPGGEILFVTAHDPSGIGFLRPGSSAQHEWLKHPGYGVFNARLRRTADGWRSMPGRTPGAGQGLRREGPRLVGRRRQGMDRRHRRRRRPGMVAGCGSALFLVESRRLSLPVGAASRPGHEEPTGSPMAIQHFHSRGLSWRNLYLGAPDIAVARDKIVFNLGEHSGNVWLTDLPPPSGR